VVVIADELRTRMRTAPFKPFTVVTASGERVHVHHHDYAWVSPLGGEFHVYDAKGKSHLVYTSHITNVIHEESPEGPAPSLAEQP
jgi:hypothetical protein